MAELDEGMDLAESAQKTPKPKVDSAERERQKKFYAQLRSRSVPQPK